MLDPTMRDRFNNLVETKVAERRYQFLDEIAKIDRQLAAKGFIGWSMRPLQHKQAHEREVEIRAELAWASLIRVHKVSGCPIDECLREDLRTEIYRQIESAFDELSRSLVETLQYKRGNPQAPTQTPSLFDARRNIFAKYDVEVDLYVDALNSSWSSEGVPLMTQNNFYGTIGSVQTGASSTANVVQNLGPVDRDALIAALEDVREAIHAATTIDDIQRHELIEIASECAEQMATASPNNTKLLTLLNVLGITVQSIASAQPAYQSLKIALIPFGITLP